MYNKILLTNIQRFSLHDGPGIRTTVFLKGCSLRCPWCSNPENILPQSQPYMKDGVEGMYGLYYRPEDLITECLKDQPFFEWKIAAPEFWCISSSSDLELLPGGVTFSGGEALLQMPALVPVMSALHDKNIHLAVETCLFVPKHMLLLALEYIDFFYIDMKILSASRCIELEKGDINLYINNLKTVMNWKNSEGKRKPIVIRIPVIGSYTDDRPNRIAVHDLIKLFKDSILKIELIKEHNLAESKYKSLNLELDYHCVDNSLMEEYKDELSDLGILTEICSI